MAHTRRRFLSTTSATAALVVGSTTILPFIAHGADKSGDYLSPNGVGVRVHPVRHASVVLEVDEGVIYCDPVGDVGAYANFPRPDLILITHHHGDHYNADTLNGLVRDDTRLIVNPTVYGKLPENLKSKSQSIANGDETKELGITVKAIGAYNTSEGRKKFHPKGRDNGYVLSLNGLRIYVSGDTEDVPEMRALTNIDLAFVCMNLPFTMDINAAASAVAEFKPTFVYPYHYRGRDGGTQDPKDFAKLVGEASDVRLGDWYG